MDLKEFLKKFKEYSEQLNIKIEENKIEQFYKYMLMIQEWNEKVNLTAITEPNEMIIKHFIDSLTIIKDINDNSDVIDVGTGAGFPGIPLKIANSSLNITLLDSLNKRTIFLQEVVDELKLENVEIIHGRAEDFAQDKKYREKFDYAVSRAVAPLNILSEYLIPFVKVNGMVLAMKGSNALEEIETSKKALEILESKVIKTEKLILPENNGERYIIAIEKKNKTKKIYPRKAGTPKKNPL